MRLCVIILAMWGSAIGLAAGTYSAGLAARSAAPETARAFIAFLTRPAFKAKFAAAGLDYKQP